MLITFEGGDGSGKTTQIGLLRDALVRRGMSVVMTREPGGTPIGDAIRKILLDGKNLDMTPECELLLYAAARAQHVNQQIALALQEGQIVLCDRFIDATRVYQGVARGMNALMIARLEEFVLGDVRVDQTILLDLPAHVGLTRARRRLAGAVTTALDEGRFEAEALVFHEKVRQGYRDAAEREPARFCVVDAMLPVDDQAKIIVDRVGEWLHV